MNGGRIPVFIQEHDLRFSVWAQIFQFFLLYFGVLVRKVVSDSNRHGHKLRCLIYRPAEHESLVTSPRAFFGNATSYVC